MRSALRLCVWLIYDLYLKILRTDDALLPALGAEEREILQHRPLQQPQPRFRTADGAKDPFFLRSTHGFYLFACRRHEPCEKRAAHGFEASQGIRFPVPAGGHISR